MVTNDVFISYSTMNTQIANDVRKFLQSHGINCWMAPESIPAGSNYTKEIPYGIIYSKLAVLIVSSAALNSVWVNHEITYLLDINRTIIPFIVEDIKKHPSLDTPPFSDVITSESKVEHDNEDSFVRLLYIIQKQLGMITSFKMPDCSDDYLQLGLKDIKEDGGMLIDEGNAEYYLKKAAELGNATAMRHLALLISSEGNFEDARIWWEMAAQKGDVPAIVHEVKRMLYNGSGNPKENLTVATEILQKAIVDSEPEACTLYAEYLLNPLNGYHNTDNTVIAIKMLEEALKNGYIHAATILGDVYRIGDVVIEDASKAFNYYKIASNDDSEEEATLKMADCYFSGYGTKKDLKAAFRGYADFCFYSDEYTEKYADCYNYGYGTNIDKEKALELYQFIPIDEDGKLTEIQERVLNKRFELGDSECADILGKHAYANEDYEEAFHYFSISAQNDEAEGILDLAICYFYGHGVAYNMKKAFYLFSKSYSMKCQKAAIYLAQCYEFGIGTTKNESFKNYFLDVASQDENGIWKLSFLY